MGETRQPDPEKEARPREPGLHGSVGKGYPGAGQIVVLDTVSRTYAGHPAVEALRPTSLSIYEGDYVAIMGPSGSGKSTLLNILGLLDLPTTGRYQLDGKDVNGLADAELTGLRGHYLGFVFQFFHLLAYRTSLENVQMGMLYGSIPASQRRKRALRALDRVGLSHRADALPSMLSGGERQRVAIARAIANRPQLLLCDEPTGNLDSGTARSILDLLDVLHADGLTLVMVTHDHEVAKRATRRVMIRDGVTTEPAGSPEPRQAIGSPERPARRPRARMGLRALLVEAIAGVTMRPVRSALTTLGTVIGVGTVVATLGLTSTAAAQISSRFDELKATQVVIEDGKPDREDPPFPPDVETRLARLNGVTAAGLFGHTAGGETLVRSTPIRDPGVGGEAALNIVVASPGALGAAGVHLHAGRLYDHFHDQRGEQVALLGAGAARQLGINLVANRPAIFIGDKAFTVLGIVDDVERRNELLLSVVVPVRTAQRLWGSEDLDLQVIVKTELGAAQMIGDRAAIAIRPEDPDRLVVLVPPDPEALRGDVEGDVNALFLLLAGISLAVGAIGIANTTLVSVLERVPEIGLRRALGSARRHIALQFITESTVLGTLGGVLGTCLGIMAVVGVAFIKQWTAVMAPTTTTPAPLIGTVIGLLAGCYPAFKAATTEPVRALNR
jgi:macrolide transport system ATP-binding/permease protein